MIKIIGLFRFSLVFFGASAALLPAFGVAAVPTGKAPQPVLRLGDSPEMLRLDPKGRFLAFRQDEKLKVLDLKDSGVHLVGVIPAGPTFTWAPDGFRLLYVKAAAVPAPGNDPTVLTSTEIEVFDAALGQSKTVRKLASATGFPTMDPRTLGAYVFTPDGLTTVKLSFPDDRLAKWQIAHRDNGKGKYVATGRGMLWFNGDGTKMTQLEDDGAVLESFSVSPDGSAVSWATVDGYVYRSHEGSAAELVDRGRDPAWHPEKNELLYAGARMSGNKISGYDLKVANSSDKRFITSTPFSDERWPQWHHAGKRIFYTVARTTDLFMVDMDAKQQ